MPVQLFGIQPGYAFVIIAHQPRRNNYVTALKPIIADVYVFEMFSPFNTLNISFVAIIQIMIAWNKIHRVKVCIQMLQGLQAVVECHDVDAGSIVVPVA